MEFMTYSQAVGESEPSGLIFIPGEDFDPSDPDEVEIVMLASEIDRSDRMRQLEAENARLRRIISDLAGDLEDANGS